MRVRRDDVEMVVGFGLLALIMFALVVLMQEMSGLQGVLFHILTGR